MYSAADLPTWIWLSGAPALMGVAGWSGQQSVPWFMAAR